MTDKITLSNVTTFTNDNSAVTTVNANNALIVAGFDNTLSLNGTAPNQMQANFDMNGNNILNLPQGTSDGNPVTVSQLNAVTTTSGNMPVGGTTGQILTKHSNTTYDAIWSVPASPNLTGPITSVGNATAVASQTGTGSTFVMNTSPTLVTPNIGAATATSVNGNTITSSTGTLTLGSAKTLVANNSLTLAGTDSTTITFQGTDTYVGRTTTDTLTNKTLVTPALGTPASGNLKNCTGVVLNGAAVQGAALAPTGTTSATLVMMGLGSSFTVTPVNSTRLKIEIPGTLSLTSSGATLTAKIFFGTGTAPVNGAAFTGTQIGGGIQWTSPSVGASTSFSNGGLITGLTLGTTYWFDIALSTSAGTASISCSFTGFEI